MTPGLANPPFKKIARYVTTSFSSPLSEELLRPIHPSPPIKWYDVLGVK